MPKMNKNRVHENKTRNKREYIFTKKHHHGSSRRREASWCPKLTMDEEFGVFDDADFHGYSDRESGKLYGMLKTANTRARTLGTKREQVAVFDPPRQGPWHGYPVYPLNGDGDRWRLSPDLQHEPTSDCDQAQDDRRSGQ
jgi:hypothetical protein